ncbi:MAG: helix-turn-helix domain-containing protein [Oscillospiraceae bacterium]|jgi:DNA-binding transcriptional regulator YiaG|nr:helix-turn-helix domain-containing protein [Oscillospiraceae bacterium]
MMMRAYPETYLDDAMNALGDMFDYVVYDCAYNLAEFYSFFLVSGVAYAFGRGAPKYVAGLSGPELAAAVLWKTKGERPQAEPSENIDKSPEYWAGWILAYYQWYTGRSFAELNELGITTDHLLNIYPTLHEADVSKFVALADALIEKNARGRATKLQTIRKAVGLTQKALANEAGVTLRMIQLYEQRNKDINKAQAITLARIARVLGCRIESLLESEPHIS